jgi:hypothetical protein
VVLDFNKVSRGELVAGAAGIALIVFMLAVHWYGVSVTGLLPVETARGGVAVGFRRDAFEAFTFLDAYLLVTALAAIALPLIRASQPAVLPSVPVNLIVGGLGIAAAVLLAIRLIDPPDLVRTIEGVQVRVTDNPNAEVTREPGPWLGLAAAVGIAAGGLMGRRPA